MFYIYIYIYIYIIRYLAASPPAAYLGSHPQQFVGVPADCRSAVEADVSHTSVKCGGRCWCFTGKVGRMLKGWLV